MLYSVYPFRWSDLQVEYPAHLKKLAEAMPVAYHLGLQGITDAFMEPGLCARHPICQRPRRGASSGLHGLHQAA